MFSWKIYFSWLKNLSAFIIVIESMEIEKGGYLFRNKDDNIQLLVKTIKSTIFQIYITYKI